MEYMDKVTSEDKHGPEKRAIRIFVSSTFKDMIEDRNKLMTHTWPELRLFCRERHVEIVEVDLRWGIAEEQSKRNETLKLCLDEINACRPFFIGLLGERYGGKPDDNAFTEDLNEEHPWLNEHIDKSYTELEILHGVLNNPEMAGRTFFYYRDPAYALEHGTDFLSENEEAAEKQTALKEFICKTCEESNIPLPHNYPNPDALAVLVLEQLKEAIEAQFPKADIPDPLDREDRDHGAFAEIRCRTYIGRTEYFDVLDRHANTEGAPLLLLGDSGSGKSALLSNWIDRWRKTHPEDFIFQHYIGGTPDSAVHWKLMTRLMAEIKRWTDDPDELPSSNDEILKDFSLWLAKARTRAQRDGIRFIVVLDALNQLDEKDHGHLLGWLPEHPFTGALKLIVSTLPGDTLEVVEKRTWQTLRIQPLTTDERREMTVSYLKRFGKQLDKLHIDHLVKAESTSNPLYLKILLDELKVTGTHDNLKKRLDDYLAEREIPGLLVKILKRYEHDYERDRKGLVGEVLGLIWASRRGLTEVELLKLLRPEHLPQLPLATWSPIRAALEESLVDRGGIFNFAHDFLRTAVETTFLPDPDTKKKFRIILADYFEAQSPTARSCDELPWLLWKTGMDKRLRNCLLDIDNFLEINKRDENELLGYWVYLNEERSMGKPYLDSFYVWFAQNETNEQRSNATNELGGFLYNASLYNEAESFYRLSINIIEKSTGKNHPDMASSLNNLAALLQATNRFEEAESLYKKALKISKESLGKNHPNVALNLNNLAELLKVTNSLSEAESLFREALKVSEESLGQNHPNVALNLNNLAELYRITDRLNEAESLFRRGLKIYEKSLGENHPNVAMILNNLAQLLQATNRFEEAEALMKRALNIDEEGLGKNHPKVAICLGNLAELYRVTDRLSETESLMKRALKINEESLVEDHSQVAICLSNLAELYRVTNRMSEAERHFRRALKIYEERFDKNHFLVASPLNNFANLLKATNRLDEAELLYKKALKNYEVNFGKEHPYIAICLGNLVELYRVTNRLSETLPLTHRMVEIIINATHITNSHHPKLQIVIKYYSSVRRQMGWSEEQINAKLRKITPEIF